jgi:membrane protein YdbS with pleckstrin-like domain
VPVEAKECALWHTPASSHSLVFLLPTGVKRRLPLLSMPFPARLLTDGEEVVVDVRPHWWYLAGPVLVLGLVIIGAISAAVLAAPSWLDWVAIAALALAAVWLVGRYIRWASTSLVVTNHRLISRTGVLVRSSREIPLLALTDISYRQNLLERIIGAGDVLLESAGREGREVFPDLPRPARIQQAIVVQMDQARRQGSGGSGSGGPAAWLIPAQIEHLDVLRRRGVITDAEFQAKKTELLDRL